MSSPVLLKRWVGPAQAWFVRAYKVVGLVALAAILIGLIGFLVINVFYLFDNSWVRPEILSPSHERVIEITGKIAAETTRKNELVAERDQRRAELAAIERAARVGEQFEAAVGSSGIAREGATSYEALMLWREHDRSALERQALADRRVVIARELEMLDAGIERYEKLIAQLSDSPYVAATEGDVTVAFVPYENLETVKQGRPVYGCKLGLIWCSEVGTVGRLIKGEIQNSHPHSGSVLRGVLFEIHLEESWAAKQGALFVGGRPFWLL